MVLLGPAERDPPFALAFASSGTVIKRLFADVPLFLSISSRTGYAQATSFFIRPVELLVLRFIYMLYFAATLLVYRFAGAGPLCIYE